MFDSRGLWGAPCSSGSLSQLRPLLAKLGQLEVVSAQVLEVRSRRSLRALLQRLLGVPS